MASYGKLLISWKNRDKTSVWFFEVLANLELKEMSVLSKFKFTNLILNLYYFIKVYIHGGGFIIDSAVKYHYSHVSRSVFFLIFYIFKTKQNTVKPLFI